MFRDFHHIQIGVKLDRNREFLLGRLPAGEAAALRERLFADEGMFDELEAAERDLLDSYARGDLAESDRRDFEAHLLTSDSQRGKLRFARAFQKSPVSRQVLPWAIAAMLLLSLGASSWYAMSLRSQIAGMPRVNSAASVAFLLTPVRRGGEEVQLAVDSAATFVRLDLETVIPEDRSAEVFIKSTSGAPVLALNRVRVRDIEGLHYVSVWLPRSSLRSGAYSITVQEGDLTVSTYSFSVR